MLRTLFAGGLVFDGSGSAPVASDVVIEGDRIVALGSGLDGDVGVDCGGKTVAPGFIDCHVHVTVDDAVVFDLSRRLNTPFSMQFFTAATNLEKTLHAGVTTARDAGYADLGVKQAVSSGLIPGPELKIAITILSQTGGHGDQWVLCGADISRLPHPGRPASVVDGADEMRRRVREVIRAGADVIKVCTSGGVLSPRDDPRHGHFRDHELEVVAEEVAAAGMSWMAHAQATDGIKSALRNGVRSIEHGIYLDDEAIEMMLASGTWLVPTLSAPRGVLAARDEGLPVPQIYIDKTEMVIQAHTDSFTRAVKAGVKVAMGTDAGVCRHGDNLGEIDLMVQNGMDPAAALAAATTSAADLLGMAGEVGAIAIGARADLTVVDGDILDTTGLGKRVTQVWQRGTRVR